MTSFRMVHLVLTLLCLAVSGPAIRFADAPALAVVLYRIALCWPVLAAVAIWRRERWPLRSGIGAGLCLALHWVSWVMSVQSTTLASASLLISTGALWSALLSHPVLGERVHPRQWVGLAVALAGVVLVVTVKQGGRHTFEGDMLALLGSLAWVAYTFVGRRARQVAGFWSYTATVYGTAALCALAAAVSLAQPLAGYTSKTWFALAVVALFPTLIGHGSVNYLLRHIGPARLSLMTLVEPILTTLAAWPLFGEIPGAQLIAGGALTLVGVALGVKEPASARSPEERPAS